MKHLYVILLTVLTLIAVEFFFLAVTWGQENGENHQHGAEQQLFTPEIKETGGHDIRDDSENSGHQLVQLLEILKNMGGDKKYGLHVASSVRKKAQIAGKLGKFDDYRAEKALIELIREDACEESEEDGVLCVKWEAIESLEKIQSRKDLKLLSSSAPLDVQLKIINKYGSPPHTNEHASHVVRNFLISMSTSNPQVYVPLLVENFTHSHALLKVGKQFPEETDIGLQHSLFSSNLTIVWHAIHLARVLERDKFLQAVFRIAFEKGGKIDYGRQNDVEAIQTAAIGYFRQFETDALPFYRTILYGDFAKGKEYVISGIRDVTNPDLLVLLKEYDAYLATRIGEADQVFVKRLHDKIHQMEDARQ